jgi:two-component system NtrC family sensor kinase
MQRIRANSLAVRLTGTLVAALAALLLFSWFVSAGLQERFAESTARLSALALSETLTGSLHGQMLANDRAGLGSSVRAITERSPNIRVRVFNKEGEIAYSSLPNEAGTRVDTTSEACFKCHAAGQPIERLPAGDRTRDFTLDGLPAVGVIRPIENEPACSNAACHAHPASKRLLGVVDVSIQLVKQEEVRRQTTLLMAATGVATLVLVAVVVVLVVRRNVQSPVRHLADVLGALGGGDYTARYEDEPISEFAFLGRHVNRMANDLQKANAEIVDWAQTLERRVEEKTGELKAAQAQMLRVERMASLGKLAAVVAHEINNPLASVVTYSKLLLRRFAQKGGPKPGDDSEKILEAIASESARCGEIVSNLLLFARRTGSRMEPTDVNKLVDRSLFLLKHKMDLAQVRAEEHLSPGLPHVLCDPSQVEQAILALAINGIEAMPEGGTLTVVTAPHGPTGARIEIADTGVGMDEDVKKQIFEPFFTTKGDGEGKGLGLGLAVVYGIVQRHGGAVDVESAPAAGTRFVLTLPGTASPGEES